MPSPQCDNSSLREPLQSPRTQKSTPVVALLLSFLLTATFFSVGIIFLACPVKARHLLYPCLSRIEHDNASIIDSRTVLESDTIRLAGACFVSLAVSSLTLLVPLLPCCHYGRKQKRDSTDYLRDSFFLRTLFFLQATMGLTLIGVGLFNLENAESNHSYDGGGRDGSNSKGIPFHSQCSSLKDQTVLWMGVAIICATSLGLMSSFLPEAQVTDDQCDLRDNAHTTPRRLSWWCCCQRNSRTHPNPSLEPLLPEEGQSSNERKITNDEVCTQDIESAGRTVKSSASEPGIDEERIETRKLSKVKSQDEPPPEQSSRLRGTARLLKLAGRQSLYLWVGIAVLLIRLPFSLAIPHFVSAAIGDLIDEDYDGAKRSVLLLFLLGTVDSVLDFWCIFLFGYAKENIVKGVRIDTFTSILSQEQAFFDRTNTGDLNSRLTADCGEMAGDLTWFFRFSVEAAVRIIGISTYMIIRSPFLGLCTLAIVPVVGVINKVYGDWLGKNATSVQNSLAEASTVAHESLACIKTVITSASEEYECEKYSNKINKLFSLNIRQSIATGVYFMAVSTFLINTCVQSALLYVGSILVEEGKLTPEILLAFMLYQGQLQEYTLNLFQSYSSLIKSSGAGDRVFLLLDREPPPPGTGNQSVKCLVDPSIEDATYKDIAIRNVKFSYPTRPDTLALNDFSLEIKGLTALVGPSGCGKSTIVSLLERLYDPDEGTIKFGDVHLKSMNLKAHRQKIGLVTQDPVLFSGSIRENIGYGLTTSLEEVVEAAKVANAHDFIESFPNKYEELVGERGMNLSGGQKQRIAIARAIIRKPALLLLDEATSALDPESEAAVQIALNDLLQSRSGMTTVIIAHRLQTVRNADTIAVIRDGCVVEQGSHVELVQNADGHYRRMVDRADSMGILPDMM